MSSDAPQTTDAPQTSRIGRLLCRVGLHRWAHVYGLRHWHVECRGCGKRQVWRDHDTRQGYQPTLPGWENTQSEILSTGQIGEIVESALYE